MKRVPLKNVISYYEQYKNIYYIVIIIKAKQSSH